MSGSGFKISLPINTFGIQSDKDFHDIELRTSGGSLTANRCFLVAVSKNLRKILKENPATKVINLPTFSKVSVEALLHLIYCGELILTERWLLDELTSLANMLEIRMPSFSGSKAFAPNPIAPNSIAPNPKESTDGNNNGKKPYVKRLVDGKFKCGICHKIFKHHTNARNHIIRTHSGSTEKLIQCQYPGCKKAFLYKRYLDNHVQRIHSKTSALPNIVKSEIDQETPQQNSDEIPKKVEKAIPCQ